MKEFPSFLKEGEPARLIPVLAESNKEQRATSVTLAVLTAVDEFGYGLLRLVDAPPS